MSSIFALPNEIVDAIVSVIDDDSTLIALAQTCSRLQPFAEAQLFRNIYIRDGQSVKRFQKDLDQPRWRLRAVEHLEVTPTSDSWGGMELNSWGGIALMPELIGRLKNLKSLKVESPTIRRGLKPSWWWDSVMIGYMDLFARNGALGCLTSFTLHSHGADKRNYNIKKVLPVFLSPTLKYLHLSCLDISCAIGTFAALGSKSQSMRTPLETLILQRCTVPSSCLDEFQAILSLPRALRSFTVLFDAAVQRVHAPEFIGALQQQSHSLEYLRYMDRPIERPFTGSPEHLNFSLFSMLSALCQSSTGLSTFHRLHTFCVDYRSNFAEFLLNKELAPPNLHTLGLTGLNFSWRWYGGHNHDISWHHIPAFVSAITTATPFSHLRLHTKPGGLEVEGVSNFFSLPAVPDIGNDIPAVRDVLLGLAKTLDKRSTVKIVCSYQERQLAGFHPPFLYGEILPVEAVVFNSEKLRSGEGNVDKLFKVEKYISEDGELSGWNGPFSALGNSFWKW